MRGQDPASLQGGGWNQDPGTTNGSQAVKQGDSWSWEQALWGGVGVSISSTRDERTSRGFEFLWATWPSQNDSGPQQEGMGLKPGSSHSRESHWLIQES